MLGCVLTKRRGMSVLLIDQIIETVSRKMAFLSKQKELSSLQKRALFLCQRQFIGHAKNVWTEGQQQIATVYATEYESAKAMQLDDILLYPFPSRQYIQEIFVCHVLDLLPMYEKALMHVYGECYVPASRGDLEEEIYMDCPKGLDHDESEC
jgi:hypothetical protein